MLQGLEAAGNETEIGGILLGHRLGRRYFVTAITMDVPMESANRRQFLLDGPKHTKEAQDIVSQFVICPEVLGIWHSHICDDDRFSEQDRAAHSILTLEFGSILSFVAYDFVSVSHYAASVHVVHKDGREEKYALLRQSSSSPIPRRLLRKNNE